jgi:hypothetical protein
MFRSGDPRRNLKENIVKYALDDGDAYIQGRSPEKARELLAAAEEAGIDTALVRTTSDGYIVPKELGGDTGDDDNVLEIGMGVPSRGYSTALPDQPGGDDVNAAVADNLLGDIQPVSDAGHVEAAILNQSAPTNATTEGTAEGNGSQTVGDSAVLGQDFDKEAQDKEQGLTDSEEEADKNAAEARAELFDPSEHTVAEVEEYLESADEDERERVLAAEAEGKARKSLLPDEEGK